MNRLEFRRIAPGYSEKIQIIPVNLTNEQAKYGIHIIFWGENENEIKRLTDNLPEIINDYHRDRNILDEADERWEIERSSGILGLRCKKCGTWRKMGEEMICECEN